jgi:hypothetical protein
MAHHEGTAGGDGSDGDRYSPRRGAETGRLDLDGLGERPAPVNELSRTTGSHGTSDADLELLDSIEAELGEVERTLAGLDDDGP